MDFETYWKIGAFRMWNKSTDIDVLISRLRKADKYGLSGKTWARLLRDIKEGKQVWGMSQDWIWRESNDNRS